MTKAQRIIHLVDALQKRKGGVSLNNLAQIFQVSTRTIRRDLQDLQLCGLPIVDLRSGVNTQSLYTITQAPPRRNSFNRFYNFG